MFNALLNVWNHPYNKSRRLKALAIAIWWKCNQLFFHLPAVVKITDEFSIICYPESSFGSYIVYARWPEYDECRFLATYLEKNDVYVDIGAHIGSELLVAASKITKGRMFGFEPTLTTYGELLQNIQINSLEAKIKLFQQAVSNKSGVARFVLGTNSEMNHLSTSRKSSQGEKVKVVTLDEFAMKNKIKKINVLKVDTEGAELQVFLGAKNLLKEQQVEVILFEVNQNISSFGATINELLIFLEKQGLQLFEFSNGKLKRIKSTQFVFKKTTNLVAGLKTAIVKKRLRKLL